MRKRTIKGNLGKNYKGIAVALAFTALSFAAALIFVMGVSVCL